MRTETVNDGILEHWSAAEVADAFARDDIVLIDVRTPQEYAFERIDGALLAPLQAFRPEHLPDQSVKRIVLHCGSGMRSRRVAERCLAAGHERIAHLEGGLGAWKQAGLQYTGTDTTSGAPVHMRTD